MEKFKKEMMSIELYCSCVSEEYFDNNLREYYDFLHFELCKSELYCFYKKNYYKLKVPSSIMALGLDMNFYRELPCFICVSEIY